jgi:hypothetical protein
MPLAGSCLHLITNGSVAATQSVGARTGDDQNARRRIRLIDACCQSRRSPRLCTGNACGLLTASRLRPSWLCPPGLRSTPLRCQQSRLLRLRARRRGGGTALPVPLLPLHLLPVLSILPVTTMAVSPRGGCTPRVKAVRSWPARSGVRLCKLVVAAMMMAWPSCFADADPRNPVVVIVPQVRLPSQQPPHFPTQPALQWAPPPAVGLTPGLRSPAPRCYAGTTVCPLERPELLGKGCTCNTASGLRTGRALIPPVHDAAGRS